MHAEPISEHLVNENAPGTDSVNTFEEWAEYARSNAIVSPPSLALCRAAYQKNPHQSTFHPIGTAALAPEYLRGTSSVAPLLRGA